MVTTRFIAVILCFTFGISIDLMGQDAIVINNEANISIKNYAVLPDQNYSFERINSDTSLKYQEGNTLQVNKKSSFWIRLRIVNPYANDERYILTNNGPVNFRLYYFDHKQQQWRFTNSGNSFVDQYRFSGTIPITLTKNSETIFYLKTKFLTLRNEGLFDKKEIIIEKELSFNEREKYIWLSWLACMFILVYYTISNLYLYYQLKDKAYLYYVVTQIGVMFFLTAYQSYFHIYLPFRVFTSELINGTMYIYDFNLFLVHISLVVLFWGYLHFVRTYLNTKVELPFFDRWLRFLSYGYAVFELIPALLTFTGIYYTDAYLVRYDNFFIMLIILSIIVTSLVGVKRRTTGAKQFLIANLVPIILMASTSIYSILYDESNSLLVEVAIITQIFSFGAILVVRLRLLKDELREKEIEAAKLAAAVEISTYKSLLVEQEHLHEKERNELLKLQLETKQRELVSSSLQIHQKSKLLADLKTHIKEMPDVKNEAITNISSSLKNNAHLDSEWDKFKLHFEEVHPNFFEDLKTKYPKLTNYELRLYAYFHINLSTKEIAALLNIAATSVKQAKARLKKKMEQ